MQYLKNGKMLQHESSSEIGVFLVTYLDVL